MPSPGDLRIKAGVDPETATIEDVEVYVDEPRRFQRDARWESLMAFLPPETEEEDWLYRNMLDPDGLIFDAITITDDNTIAVRYDRSNEWATSADLLSTASQNPEILRNTFENFAGREATPDEVAYFQELAGSDITPTSAASIAQSFGKMAQGQAPEAEQDPILAQLQAEGDLEAQRQDRDISERQQSLREAEFEQSTIPRSIEQVIAPRLAEKIDSGDWRGASHLLSITRQPSPDTMLELAMEFADRPESLKVLYDFIRGRGIPGLEQPEAAVQGQISQVDPNAVSQLPPDQQQQFSNLAKQSSMAWDSETGAWVRVNQSPLARLMATDSKLGAQAQERIDPTADDLGAGLPSAQRGMPTPEDSFALAQAAPQRTALAQQDILAAGGDDAASFQIRGPNTPLPGQQQDSFALAQRQPGGLSAPVNQGQQPDHVLDAALKMAGQDIKDRRTRLQEQQGGQQQGQQQAQPSFQLAGQASEPETDFSTFRLALEDLSLDRRRRQNMGRPKPFGDAFMLAGR